jgi:hypothetical protein
MAASVVMVIGHAVHACLHLDLEGVPGEDDAVAHAPRRLGDQLALVIPIADSQIRGQLAEGVGQLPADVADDYWAMSCSRTHRCPTSPARGRAMLAT